MCNKTVSMFLNVFVAKRPPQWMTRQQRAFVYEPFGSMVKSAIKSVVAAKLHVIIMAFQFPSPMIDFVNRFHVIQVLVNIGQLNWDFFVCFVIHISNCPFVTLVTWHIRRFTVKKWYSLLLRFLYIKFICVLLINMGAPYNEFGLGTSHRSYDDGKHCQKPCIFCVN